MCSEAEQLFLARRDRRVGVGSARCAFLKIGYLRGLYETPNIQIFKFLPCCLLFSLLCSQDTFTEVYLSLDGAGDGAGMMVFGRCDEGGYSECLADSFTEFGLCAAGHPFPPSHCLARLSSMINFTVSCKRIQQEVIMESYVLRLAGVLLLCLTQGAAAQAPITSDRPIVQPICDETGCRMKQLEWCKYEEREIDGSLYCCTEFPQGFTSCHDNPITFPGFTPGFPNFGCNFDRQGERQVLRSVWTTERTCSGTDCDGTARIQFLEVDIRRSEVECREDERGFRWQSLCKAERQETVNCEHDELQCSKLICGRDFDFTAQPPRFKLEVSETDTCRDIPETFISDTTPLEDLAELVRAAFSTTSTASSFSSAHATQTSLSAECVDIKFE